MLYIKNRYTNKVFSFPTKLKASNWCKDHGVTLEALYTARREGRFSKTAFYLCSEKEYVDYLNKQKEELEKLSSSEIKTALIASDIHFCYEDKDAVDIFYQVAKDYAQIIDEFIDMGDGINNGALSRFTDVETGNYTLYDEILAYKNHISKLKTLIPDAKFTVLQDNHYHLRKRNFLADNPAFKGMIPDLSYLFDEEVSHARLYFPFEQKRFGLIHGNSIGKHFTQTHLEEYGRYDVMCGHTHTLQVYVSQSGSPDDPARRSYGIPSMCKHMEYTNNRPTRQVCGFAMITFDEKTNNYNVEYIIVEDKRAIFRGRLYESKFK